MEVLKTEGSKATVELMEKAKEKLREPRRKEKVDLGNVLNGSYCSWEAKRFQSIWAHSQRSLIPPWRTPLVPFLREETNLRKWQF